MFTCVVCVILTSFTVSSNLHYTRGITSKSVTIDGIHIRGTAPGQHISEGTSQRWRAVGDTGSDLTGSGIEPMLQVVTLVTIKLNRVGYEGNM